MALIPARLLADLHPNGTVRIVFIAHIGGGNERPITAKNPDAAEIVFMRCGLTPERAVALRGELERNKAVSLDQFKGLNQIGDIGLRDQVNNHYLHIFGVSLAIGAIGGVAQAGTTGSLTASGIDLMRQGFAQSTAQSSAHILDKFLNIMPTVTIREGHRVKVYLSGDLELPDYNNHKMPSDL